MLDLAYVGYWASEQAPAREAVQGDRDSDEGGVDDDRVCGEPASKSLPDTCIGPERAHYGRGIRRSAEGFGGARSRQGDDNEANGDGDEYGDR